MLTTLPSPSAQTIRQSVPDQEDIIRRSLERSARYGVDPHLDGAPESTRLSDEQLRERINGQRVFYTLAKEQIDSLYRLLRDTGFCMALADSEGYVLYVVGDSDLPGRRDAAPAGPVPAGVRYESLPLRVAGAPGGQVYLFRPGGGAVRGKNLRPAVGPDGPPRERSLRGI